MCPPDKYEMSWIGIKFQFLLKEGKRDRTFRQTEDSCPGVKADIFMTCSQKQRALTEVIFVAQSAP